MSTVKKRSIAFITVAALAFTLLLCGMGINKETASAATYVTAYTDVPYLYVAKTKKGKATKIIPYKSKVRVYGSIARKTKGRYVKIKYKGYYYWEWVAKNTKPFVKTGLNFTKYRNACKNEMTKKIINKALYIRTKKTVYSHNTPGSLKNGKMCFDCSGFASYVINGVMKNYVKPYKLSASIKTIYDTNYTYTGKGTTTAEKDFKATVVCTGTPNFNKLQPGDIVYFNENGGACDHCGIYLGNKQFIHSTKQTNGVSIMPLNKLKYKKCFLKAKRVVPAAKPAPIATKKVPKNKWGVIVYSTRACNGTATKLPADTKLSLRYKYNINFSGATPKQAYISYKNDAGNTKYAYVLLKNITDPKN